jgi:outer membrane lipoprotein-sorting protein
VFFSRASRGICLVLALCPVSVSGDAAIESQVNLYIGGLISIVAEFVQVCGEGGPVYTGKFWLSKNGETLVKVKYITGVEQEILIKGGYISILDKAQKKLYKYPVSRSPIFSVLHGRFDLAKEKYEILEDGDENLRVRIYKPGSGSVELVFSRYQNRNIKNLEAWIIDDGSCTTLFSFDVGSLRINDKSKIPQGTFEFSK